MAVVTAAVEDPPAPVRRAGRLRDEFFRLFNFGSVALVFLHLFGRRVHAFASGAVLRSLP